MSKVQKGTVKFYNKEKKFGFFVPDASRQDRKEIFFHNGNGCKVQESELFLVFGDDKLLWFDPTSQLDREPEKGDRIVAAVKERPKGPCATEWTYESIWDMGMRIIDARPQPNTCYCHVLKCCGADQKPEILWDGWRTELDGYLAASGTNLSDEQIVLEELRPQGWGRVWNPKLSPSTKIFGDLGTLGSSEKEPGWMTEEELMKGLENLAPKD